MAASMDLMKYVLNFNILAVVSAFTVNAAAKGPTSGTIRFSNVVYDQGGDYNTTTGKFTCQHPGIYNFNLHLLMQPGRNYVAYCWLYKNSASQVQAYTNPLDVADEGYYSVSTSLIVHLDRGDTVYIGGCTRGTTIYTGGSRSDSFTGVLVTAD